MRRSRHKERELCLNSQKGAAALATSAKAAGCTVYAIVRLDLLAKEAKAGADGDTAALLAAWPELLRDFATAASAESVESPLKLSAPSNEVVKAECIDGYLAEVSRPVICRLSHTHLHRTEWRYNIGADQESV